MCTDADQNDQIRAQLIQGCKSNTLRKLVLQQPKIALDAILVMARSHELSNKRANDIEATLTKRAAQKDRSCNIKNKTNQVKSVQRHSAQIQQKEIL